MQWLEMDLIEDDHFQINKLTIMKDNRPKITIYHELAVKSESMQDNFFGARLSAIFSGAFLIRFVLFDGSQDFLGMTFDFYFTPFFPQHALTIDQECAAFDAPNFLAIHVFHFNDVKQFA